MRLTLVFLITIFFSNIALAGYSGGLTIKRVRVGSDGWVYFGTNIQPVDTCNNWGEYIKFNHATPEGKSLLSTLLAAKMANSSISVWYTTSGAPGTTQANGCIASEVSVLTGVSIN